MSVEILRENSNHFDWVGIYLVRENDLFLEAYAGDEETEHVRIPIGEGICGSAAEEVLGEITSTAIDYPRSTKKIERFSKRDHRF